VQVPKPANRSDEIDGFSPDGTELVFARYRFDQSVGAWYDQGTLMAEHLRGGAPVPLSKSGLPGASHLPAVADRVQWSPDGRWIAFVATNPSNELNAKFELVSTSGGKPRVLATHLGPYAFSFSWSPQSTRLAVATSDKPLATVDLHGHRTMLWTNPSLQYRTYNSIDRPQWSPDGSKLVFAATSNSPAETHIWIVGATGHGLKRIA